ncbi:hypothetical protein [Bartonella heixiaziensis]|uniref:hypothetical protein n=1 Tax=Bartonella heixiaziensis TaxID=1461000 RepID=UPI003908B808
MKTFLKTTFLIMAATVLTTGLSHAKYRTETAYVNWVKADSAGATCTLQFRYDIIPDKGEVKQGEWNCDTMAGKNILDLAKTAVILNRKVELTYNDDDSKAATKPLNAIVLK